MRERSFYFNIIKIAFAAGIIGWLFYSGHLDLSKIMIILDPKYLSIAFFVVFLNVLATGFRWWVLLQGQGFKRKFVSILPLHFIGIFFSYALPGSVSGDIVKAFYIVRQSPGRKVMAGMTVLVDRLVGLYGMLFLSLLAVLLNLKNLEENPLLLSLGQLVILSFALASVGIAMSMSRRLNAHPWIERLFTVIPLGDKFKEVYAAVHSYRNHVPSLVVAFGLSLFSQLVTIGLFVVVAQAIGEGQISIGTHFFAVPLGFISTSLPIAPAGIGVGQVAMLFLYKSFLSFHTETGQTGLTIFQVIMATWALVGAYFYVQKKSVPAEVKAHG